jgi:TolB-like protein
MKTHFCSFRIYAISIIAILFTFQSFAQIDFDTKLKSLTDTIAKKINLKGKKKVAVWDISDANGDITNLGKYLSEEISVNLTNAAQTYNMMDRNHLKTILKEHELNSEGFIDENTAKELGKWAAVDAIVTGTVTIFNKEIRLTLKVLDTETALIIAATKGDLPITSDIASFIGVPDMSSNNSSTLNRGFNHPLNSSEQYNNSGTVNAKCKEKNTGDYCFKNSTSKKLLIRYWNFYSNPQTVETTFTLEPNQTQCIYDIPAGPLNYSITESGNYYGMNSTSIYSANGQIYIEQCKSKTFIIK